jgi:fructokinase
VTGAKLNVQGIVEQAMQGDEAARQALDRYWDRLARAFAHVINILDPDCIVVGGGVSNLDALYTEIPARLPAYVFSDTVETRVVKAMYGDSSGVRGAAGLWPNELIKR